MEHLGPFKVYRVNATTNNRELLSSHSERADAVSVRNLQIINAYSSAYFFIVIGPDRDGAES